VVATGHRFIRAEEPDAAAMVSRSVAGAPHSRTVRVLVEAAVEEVARRVPPTVAVAEADGSERSTLTFGVDLLDAVPRRLVALGLPFEVLEPAELRATLRRLGRLPGRGPLPDDPNTPGMNRMPIPSSMCYAIAHGRRGTGASEPHPAGH